VSPVRVVSVVSTQPSSRRLGPVAPLPPKDASTRRGSRLTPWNFAPSLQPRVARNPRPNAPAGLCQPPRSLVTRGDRTTAHIPPPVGPAHRALQVQEFGSRSHLDRAAGPHPPGVNLGALADRIDDRLFPCRKVEKILRPDTAADTAGRAEPGKGERRTAVGGRPRTRLLANPRHESRARCRVNTAGCGAAKCVRLLTTSKLATDIRQHGPRTSS
jgi:hypothetical protein